MSEPLITGKVEGVESVTAKLEYTPQHVLIAMRAEVGGLTSELYQDVRDIYLAGFALHEASGKARASVKKAVRTGRYSITGQVFADIYYLRFWEYGFTRDDRKYEPRASFHPALDEMAARIRERLAPLALEAI